MLSGGVSYRSLFWENRSPGMCSALYPDIPLEMKGAFRHGIDERRNGEGVAGYGAVVQGAWDWSWAGRWGLGGKLLSVGAAAGIAVGCDKLRHWGRSGFVTFHREIRGMRRAGNGCAVPQEDREPAQTSRFGRIGQASPPRAEQ